MIVVWRVVNSCNLACPFCAFDRRLAYPRTETAPQDIVRFAELLAGHQRLTGDRVLLSWLGGEPLRWRPLEAVSRAARELGLEVSATTNGSTLGSAHVRRHLCENYRELTISIDGFSGFHDAMRSWPGAFEKLRRWVPALAHDAATLGSSLKLRANVVLMQQNAGELPALCSELAGWGIREITFNQLGGRDRPEFYPTHRLRPVDVECLAADLPALRRRLAGHGVALIGGDAYLMRIRASTRGERMAVEDCGPGERFLFIDEHGIISPCSFTTDAYGVDARTVLTAADIGRLPQRFRALRAARRAAQCDDCLSTQICGKFQPVAAVIARAAAA